MDFDEYLELSHKPTWIEKLLGKFRIHCEGHGPYNEAKDDFECYYWVDAPYDEKLGYWDTSKEITVECDECCLGYGRKDPRTGKNMFLLKWLLLYRKNVCRKKELFMKDRGIK